MICSEAIPFHSYVSSVSARRPADTDAYVFVASASQRNPAAFQSRFFPKRLFLLRCEFQYSRSREVVSAAVSLDNSPAEVLWSFERSGDDLVVHVRESEFYASRRGPIVELHHTNETTNFTAENWDPTRRQVSITDPRRSVPSWLDISQCDDQKAMQLWYCGMSSQIWEGWREILSFPA